MAGKPQYESKELQQLLFSKIKSGLPPNFSLADELADLLGISVDSAYRRMRGEILLNLSELQEVSKRFQLSLDQLLNFRDDTYVFSGRNMDYREFSFVEYLQKVLEYMRTLNNFPDRILYYTNRDIPLFINFGFPALAQFKYFFWMRSIFQSPDFVTKRFSAQEENKKLLETGQAIFAEYVKLPSVEIWNTDCINSTLLQIQYYRDTKVFRSEKDEAAIYNDLDTLVDHVEKQAATAIKYGLNGKPASPAASYQMFNNEFLLGDNTLLGRAGQLQFAFVNHNVLNYISTTDNRFCDYTYQSLQNLISKSTLISGVGEKDRSRFFNELRDRIDRSRNSV